MEARHRELVTAADRPDLLRVVLVDDHDRVRWAVRQLLEATGCTVVGEAADGPSGVETVLATRPDVLVTDLRLPGCDGLEVTRRVRAVLPGLRVVLFTADPPAAPLPPPCGTGAQQQPAVDLGTRIRADDTGRAEQAVPLVDAVVGKGVMPDVLLHAVTAGRHPRPDTHP